jgi:transposase
MIGFPTVSRYYLYTRVCDMRKSFAGLSGIVNNEMGGNVRSGDGFVFINKRRTMIKLLVWDRNGFVIYYKQLAGGSFELPTGISQDNRMEISMSSLLMMLEGIEMKSVRWRKRYGLRQSA